MTPQDFLEVSFDSSDLGPITVRNYLKEFLFRIFDEGEGFSGKRPFGNSGWENDLAIPLIDAQIIDGSYVTEDGYLQALDFDEAGYENAIKDLIDAL